MAERLHDQSKVNDILNLDIIRNEGIIAQKQEEIVALQARVVELEKQLGIKSPAIAKTSANSSIPPTNNDSEKALRPAKTKLKVSGCFRTETGVENYATMGPVIQTAVKNGQNPFEVLQIIATLRQE